MTDSVPDAQLQTFDDVPQGWTVSRLGDIAEVSLGKTPRKSQYLDEGTHKIVKFRDVGAANKIDWETNSKGYVADNENVVRGLRKLYTNDILVTASAHASQHIGKKLVHVSSIPAKFNDVSYVGELLCIRCSEQERLPRFIYYFLSSDYGYKAIQNHVRGVHLIASEARQILVPLAPLNEQRRIVEKVEELFTRLDAGVQTLKQTQALLESYRRSVLKAAVEGELSREWREAHGDELQPASELLEHILQERREQFAGKKYKEPASPDTSKLPEHPEGWTWLSLDQASDRIVDCLHSTPKFTQEGKYCIDTNCIAPGRILFDRARKVTESTYEERIKRLPPKEDDVLFAREGTIGTAVLVPGNVDLCLGQRMMMFRTSIGVLPRYLMWALLSPMFERQWKPRVVGTTAPHVNIRDLRIMAIPLPSLDEQHFIVEEVERHLSVVDKLEATVEANLKQADGLHQSILKQAFSGELVAQNPDDEPASVLLERVRAERQAGKPKARKGRKSRVRPLRSNHAEQEGLF